MNGELWRFSVIEFKNETKPIVVDLFGQLL